VQASGLNCFRQRQQLYSWPILLLTISVQTTQWITLKVSVASAPGNRNRHLHVDRRSGARRQHGNKAQSNWRHPMDDCRLRNNSSRNAQKYDGLMQAFSCGWTCQLERRWLIRNIGNREEQIPTVQKDGFEGQSYCWQDRWGKGRFAILQLTLNILMLTCWS